ncbi:MAG: DUF456 family protein [Armatimonadetes bacterium]|nr:DUF456 family protein [Armatimonadota bacterium]
MEQVLVVLGKVVFVALQPLAVLMAALTLPGSLLVLASAFIYSWACDWQRPAWAVLVVLAVMAALAETADNVLSVLGVRKYGGSRQTAVAAGLGTLAGAALGSLVFGWLGLAGLVAGPLGWLAATVVPPLVGAVVGGFLVAYWLERRQGKGDPEALQAGWGAVLGRVMGATAKTAITTAMAVIALVGAFWPH